MLTLEQNTYTGSANQHKSFFGWGCVCGFFSLISVLLCQEISWGLHDSVRITVIYILTLGKHQLNKQIKSSSLVIKHVLVIVTDTLKAKYLKERQNQYANSTTKPPSGNENHILNHNLVWFEILSRQGGYARGHFNHDQQCLSYSHKIQVPFRLLTVPWLVTVGKLRLLLPCNFHNRQHFDFLIS